MKILALKDMEFFYNKLLCCFHFPYHLKQQIYIEHQYKELEK